MKFVIFVVNVLEVDFVDVLGNFYVDKVKKCVVDFNVEVVVVLVQVYFRVFIIWNYVLCCNILIICGFLYISIFVVFWGYCLDVMFEFYGFSYQYFLVNNIYYVILKERLFGVGRGGIDRI